MIISSEVSHTAMIISLRCDVNRVILYTAAEMPRHFRLRPHLAPHPWGLQNWNFAIL